MKSLRLALGHSQAELSRVFEYRSIQISIASIKRIESNKFVSVRIAKEVADFYAVSLESILAETEQILAIPYANSDEDERERCLLSIKRNDINIDIEAIKHSITAYIIDTLSITQSSLVLRLSSNNLASTLQTILHRLSPQRDQYLQNTKLGCSIIAIKESFNHGTTIAGVDESDLCDLTYAHIKMTGDGILFDRELYFSVCRQFDMDIVKGFSIFNKVYCCIKPYEKQNYFGDTTQLKDYQRIVSDYSSKDKNKLFITVNGASGSGKSHWVRYLMSLYHRYYNTKDVLHIYTTPLDETQLIPRTTLFVSKILGVPVDSNIKTIKQAIASHAIEFPNMTANKAATRLEQILSRQHDHEADNFKFYDDVMIIKTLMNHTDYKVLFFDGNFKKYHYYTKVFATAFSKSAHLKHIIVSYISCFKKQFDLDGVDVLTLNVPTLSHSDQTALIKRWSNDSIPAFQVDELAINANGNLLVLRQIVLEMMGKNLISDKLTNLASLRLKQLPHSAYRLFGKLVTTMSAKCDFTWNLLLKHYQSDATILLEQGILNQSSRDQITISHDCFINAFRNITKIDERCLFIEQISDNIRSDRNICNIQKLRMENKLYCEVNRNLLIASNLRKIYQHPNTDLIFHQCMDDVELQLRIACDPMISPSNAVTDSIKKSWFSVVYGMESPFIAAIESNSDTCNTSQKRLKNEHSYIFYLVFPLLVSLEANQVIDLSSAIAECQLDKQDHTFFNAVKAYALNLNGRLDEGEILSQTIFDSELSSYSNAEDILAINCTSMLKAMSITAQYKQAESLYHSIESSLAKTVNPLNKCLLIESQLCYLFGTKNKQSIFEKAMELYSSSTQADNVVFQEIAMAFVEWERALDTGKDEHIQRLMQCYKRVIVTKQFKLFYPMFALMLSDVANVNPTKWSNEIIDHLNQAVSMCLNGGATIYLSKLYLQLAYVHQRLDQQQTASDYMKKALDCAPIKKGERMIGPIIDEWVSLLD